MVRWTAMSSRDFLHKNAETALCEHFVAAGAICRLTTNSEGLLRAARETFPRAVGRASHFDFSVRLWVDSADQAQPPWPKPYLRGLDHLVFAGFDRGSSFLADLHSRRVIGRFSETMSTDRKYWKTIIFPMLLSVMAGSVGIVELHSSCVASAKGGLILMGTTRSGKSTLAFALTELGLRLIADDRTFCSFHEGSLQAWGMPRPLKLRPEAAIWFQALSDREPVDFQNGEPVFYCDPDQSLERGPVDVCKPQTIVILELQPTSAYRLAPVSADEVRDFIEADLLAETPQAIDRQADIVHSLLGLPCSKLTFGGRPQEIAERLVHDLVL